MSDGSTERAMVIEYRPIGVVRSPFTATEGMPIQPSKAPDTEARVEVLPEYVQGLADLDGFSHLILVTHLHRSRSFRLQVVPFLDDQPRGLFATRSPSRPNPIGLSLVRLVGIDGATLTIRGIDLLDGTPVLDIKPYVPDFDHRGEVRCGWLDRVKDRQAVSDSRFSSTD